jgi:septal ring factor EnvC (AmiA/AmiB activator)
MPAVRKLKQTETDIAVLQTQVANLEEKIDDLKSDITEIKETLKSNSFETLAAFNEFKKENEEAHDKLNRKINTLEKWRYMVMGAAALAGAMGWQSIQTLLSQQ